MTQAPTLPADWRAALRARAHRPPARPRVPLLWQGTAIGSVEPAVVAAVATAPWRLGGDAAHIEAEDLAPALARLALALRGAGLVHGWRDEQLAVRDPQGRVLGAVERGAVRVLGIATHAVHLIGVSPDGRHWVQQRSLTKANDPGLWDTLMGGMVPACDGVQEALARETWEEAGLRLEQLQDLSPGGEVVTRRPSSEAPAGYIVETITWFRCVVPAGVEPRNLDGEVERFELLTPAQLEARLLGDGFTLEAALVLAAAGHVNAL